MECLEASIDSEAGVVFRSGRKENHPVCVSLVDSRNFIDDAATPPCGDARRGVRFLQNIRFASRDLHCRFIRYSPLARDRSLEIDPETPFWANFVVGSPF